MTVDAVISTVTCNFTYCIHDNDDDDADCSNNYVSQFQKRQIVNYQSHNIQVQ